VQFLGSYPVDLDDPAKGFKDPDSPIMDLRVRKALSKAVNRAELNKLLLNEGSLLYESHTKEGDLGWDARFQARFPQEYDYDPDAARQLLAEAGYGPSNPLPITVELFNGPGVVPERDDLLEAVAEMWRQVGVNPALETLDAAAFTTKLRALGFDNHAYIYPQGQPHNWSAHRNLTAHFVNHGNGFEDFEFESAYLKIFQETDPASINEAYRQALIIDYNRHSHVPLFWWKQQVVYNPKVVSGWTWPGNSSSFWIFMEHVRAA
jgi:ABC-type transport system substrate-binding protein